MVGLRGAHQRNSSRKRKRTGADEGKHSPSIRPRGKRSSKAATCWLSTSPAMARQHRNERDQYYYLNKEAHNTGDRSRCRTALPVGHQQRGVEKSLSRVNMPLKRVVVLDTCAAGAAFGDMVKLADRRELSPDQIRAIELLKDSTGSWILMGSAADAVSYEANRYA